MKHRVINIEWEGPFNVPYAKDTWDYEKISLPNQKEEKTGFYCIYGRHPVYGRDVLLYIGETKPNELNSRSFSVRFKEHFNGRFWQHINLSVHVGTTQAKLDASEFTLVESILIAAHMPALNRQYIDGSSSNSKKFVIRNYGFLGSLIPECSGEYWAKDT